MQKKRLHLLLWREYKQCKEVENSIPYYRRDDSNAIKKALLYLKEVVKAMHNGIAPLYVSYIRKRKASSQNMEEMRATRGYTELSKRATATMSALSHTFKSYFLGRIFLSLIF